MHFPIFASYSHTFANKSSFPPNPPVDLDPPVDWLLLVAVGALAQPPKSSSAATVGVGFVEEDCEVPHPAPTSFAVSVSGTFIMEDVWGGGDVVSFEPHAFPPQGFIALVESIFIALLDVVAGGDFAVGCWGEDKLKTEFVEAWVGAAVVVVVVLVVVVGGGDEKRSNISLDELGGAAGAFAEPIVAPIKLRLLDDEMEVVFVRGGGGGGLVTLEGRSSKRLPPLERPGEVILGGTGGDFGPASASKFEKLDCFCAGGDVVEGKLRPLKASVSPPKASFFGLDAGCCCSGGEARAPNDDVRSCCTG